MYEYVCNHFLATISPDHVYQNIKVISKIGNFEFIAKGQQVLEWGWTNFLPNKAIAGKPIPLFN